ncbi:hypothetical protein ACHAWC_009962 [Mediolabrus comicus]
MAFIPSTSSSLVINPSPQLLKGACSITKHTAASKPTAKMLLPTSRTRTVPIILRAKSSNDDTVNNKKEASINKENKKSSNSSKKKRSMAISKQSLTLAQKSSNSLSSSLEKNQNQNQQDQEQRAYNELLPKTGYSLADSLEKSSDKELFETILTPISGVYNDDDGMMLNNKDEEEMMMEFEYDEDGFPVGVKKKNTDDSSSNNNLAEEDKEEECSNKKEHDGIARIDTISNYGGIEPVRWIVSMGHRGNDDDDNWEERESHVMIDLPPYSDKLANEIRYFMNPEYNTTTSKSKQQTKEGTTLDAILLTNQQCIHYDSSPGVYVTRKSDLTKWKKAFPEAKVVMYRLDIPRECREEVTQVLDGYGPWGWKDEEETFVETGRPLTIEEWDEDTKSRVLKDGELPPDDEGVLDKDEESNDDDEEEDDDDPRYTKQAIREREEQHRLLAVYTPGHTFGSVTYIFPKRNICCSGFALPLESSSSVTMNDLDDDDDDDDEYGRGGSFGSAPPIGPRLDYQGYLATSASRPRQMSSALSLINNYIDRMRVVLPARGDIVFLDSDEDKRKRDLMESVGLYRKISDIYGRLGIVE